MDTKKQQDVDEHLEAQVQRGKAICLEPHQVLALTYAGESAEAIAAQLGVTPARLLALQLVLELPSARLDAFTIVART